MNNTQPRLNPGDRVTRSGAILWLDVAIRRGSVDAGGVVVGEREYLDLPAQVVYDDWVLLDNSSDAVIVSD